MAGPESNPILRWKSTRARDYSPYDQLTAFGWVGIQPILSEFAASSLPAEDKERSVNVVTDISGRIRELLNQGGVATKEENLGLGLPDDLELTNPEAFNLIREKMILHKRDLAAYPWDPFQTYANKGIQRPFPDFVVVSTGAGENLFYNYKRIYLNVQDRSRIYGGPQNLLDIFRAQAIRAYQAAKIPSYIAPLTIVRQTLFDISNDIGLGRQDDQYQFLRENYPRLYIVGSPSLNGS